MSVQTHGSLLSSVAHSLVLPLCSAQPGPGGVLAAGSPVRLTSFCNTCFGAINPGAAFSPGSPGSCAEDVVGSPDRGRQSARCSGHTRPQAEPAPNPRWTHAGPEGAQLLSPGCAGPWCGPWAQSPPGRRLAPRLHSCVTGWIRGVKST